MRGAHVEHPVHVRDAGRVEAERLVERRRVLPSRKAGVRCGARCGPGGGRAWAGSSARRACAERTENMRYMVVTLDVSKLSGWLNDRAFCRVERRACDAERGVGPVAGGRVGWRQRTSGMRGVRARL
eukprot:scaffold52794_cov50-Phaeocystis_antarctica.AAC.3